MSLLVKDYIISAWLDIYNNTTGLYEEIWQANLGGSAAIYQNSHQYVFEPNLVEKVNGEVNLTFKLYYQYIDPKTGEKEDNNLVEYLYNEAKIKLCITEGVDTEGNPIEKWYHFIVKNVSEDSSNYINTYTLNSQHIHELSKNGYGITFDTALMNNIDTAENLANTALEETDWTVGASPLVQTLEEHLIEVELREGHNSISAYKISEKEGKASISEELTVLLKAGGGTFYAFYSCCTSRPQYFQFLYFSSEEDIIIDDNNVILNGTQYLIKVQETRYQNDNLPPEFGLLEDTKLQFTSYKGNRYVFSATSIYYPALDRYVQQYIGEDDKIKYGYTTTEYITPNLVENYVSNSLFKDTSGWIGAAYFSDTWEEGDKKDCRVKTEVKMSYSPEKATSSFALLEKSYANGTYSSDQTYQNGLIAEFPSRIEKDFSINGQAVKQVGIPVLINNGFYDNKNKVGSLKNGDKFVCYCQLERIMKMKDEKKSTAQVPVYKYEKIPENSGTKWVSLNVKVQYYPGNDGYDADTGGYWNEETHPNLPEEARPPVVLMEFQIGRNQIYRVDGVRGWIASVATEVQNLNLTEKELASKKVQIYITAQGKRTENETNGKLEGTNDYVDYTTWTGAYNFLDFQIFRYVRNENSVSTIPYQINGIDEDFIPSPIYPNNAAIIGNGIDDESSEGGETEESNTAIGQIITNYFYFDEENNQSAKTADDIKYEYSGTTNSDAYTVHLEETAQKRKAITVKESNRFNIIQTIAQTFECWPRFNIRTSFDERDGVKICKQEKTLTFEERIGQENNAGFMYGINLKSIKRTLDSKNVVSKLIVKQNANKYAPNSFCTIARAKSNPLRDNILYDFTYYVKKGIIKPDDLQTLLYQSILDNGDGGYYNLLSKYNKIIQEESEKIADWSIALVKAKADLQVSVAGAESAAIKHEELIIAFANEFGYSYDSNDWGIVDNEEDENDEWDRRIAQMQNSSEISKKLIEIAEYTAAQAQYHKQQVEVQAIIDATQQWIDASTKLLEQAKEDKTELNLKFEQVMGQFIKEGTWIDESYIDDDLYYADANQVLLNSSYPKVSYTINVLELSGLPGFEDFQFNLGDRTFIEDPDFLGEGIKEPIVITEKTTSLDNPSKNSIKVQNYRSEFQDLFQTITATVQAVKNTEGAYERATELATADEKQKVAFLKDALTDAELVFKNMGEQTVTWDTKGITITDINAPSQQLRLASGAILIRSTNEAGDEQWAAAITPKGISANLITSGQINTGILQIMNGDEPTFRWDAYGLTAYYFDKGINENYINGIDTRRGVRFDRLGLYGFDGIDGLSWHPADMDEIKEKAYFSLTWDGLRIMASGAKYTNSADASVSIANTLVTLGRVSDVAYNSWNEKGVPCYDAEKEDGPYFVKVMAVGTTQGNGGDDEQFVIYSDGTVVANNIKFTGSATWAAASSPSKNVYATTKHYYSQQSDAKRPKDGTTFSSFEKNADDDGLKWHTIQSQEDSYYSHTDDGGVTWSEAKLVRNKEIKQVVNKYCQTQEQLLPENIADNLWKDDINETYLRPYYIYTKTWDVYEDGSTSQIRYGTNYYGKDGQAGLSSLMLALSNDNDVFAKHEGKIIGAGENVAIATVQCYRFEGNSATAIGNINLQTPSQGWTDKYYSWDSNNYILTIYDIPVNEKQGAFAFIWRDENQQIILEKAYTYTVLESNTDYDLIVDKTVINASSKGAINASIRVTTSDGTNIYSSGNFPSNTRLVFNNIDPEDEPKWSHEYDGTSTPLSEPITVKLQFKQSTSWVDWDKETIEIIENGAQGSSGINTATIFLYKNSNIALTEADNPTGTFVYKFEIAELREQDDADFKGWSQTIPNAEYGKKRYMIFAVAANTAGTDEITSWSEPAVYTENGSDGAEIQCYIESSLGTLIEESQVEKDSTATTTLTARVFKNGEEQTKLTYAWFVDGTENKALGTDKTITISLKDYYSKIIHFEATEQTS